MLQIFFHLHPKSIQKKKTTVPCSKPTISGLQLCSLKLSEVPDHQNIPPVDSSRLGDLDNFCLSYTSSSPQKKTKILKLNKGSLKIWKCPTSRVPNQTKSNKPSPTSKFCKKKLEKLEAPRVPLNEAPKQLG